MRRRWSVVALVVCGLAAGCLQTTETKAPIDVSTAARTFAFQPSQLVGKGGDAETSLTVSFDGQTLLACSHGGFTKPSPMWASTDAGATFRPLDPQPNPVPSGDCDVAITQDGGWYIVYDTLAGATVAATSDQGKTWRFYYVAAHGQVDRPWLQADGNNVLLVWADVMASEPFAAFLSRTTDGGRTWSAAKVIATFSSAQAPNCFLDHPMVRDAGRTIRVPISCFDGATNARGNLSYFVTSRDAGATWTTKQFLGPTQTSQTSTSYASDGVLWVVYTDAGTHDTAIMVIHSVDDGVTWSKPLRVADDRRLDLGWPWIDARPDGSATVAWLDNTRPPNATGTGQWWQVMAARVHAAPGPILDGVASVRPPYVGAAQTLEFLMVRHDAAGRALVLYPMDGDGCQQGGSAPSPGNSRNRQCVWLATESR
jgi:hypothetical protein